MTTTTSTAAGTVTTTTTAGTGTTAGTTTAAPRRNRRRRAVATTAAAVVLALGFGGVALACGGEEAPSCPAAEIQRVWNGGTSGNPYCENLTDWFDHLFYQGVPLSTDFRHDYMETVTVVQLRLRDLNYRPLAVDGLYGPQTKGAVMRYQTNHGLVVDGVVGPQTWRSLFGLGPA